MIDRKTGEIIVEYNGYTGISCGSSSYIVRDSNGREIFHTGFTTESIDTEEKALEYLKETLVMLDDFKNKEDAPVMCDYVRGLYDAWEVAGLLVHPSYNGALSGELKEKIFGFRDSDKILRNLNAQEAVEKWKNFKIFIEPGDEVSFETEDNRTLKCVITCINGDRYGYVDENGHCGAIQGRCFEKTGKRYPAMVHIIDELAGRL